MESRPGSIADEHLYAALLEGWGFDSTTIEYTPLGFGSHHWTVADGTGDRRFVTVDELDGLAPSMPVAFDELVRAFDTAGALGECGLGFVVAPLLSIDGASVRHLDGRHSIALFPYVDGRAGSFNDVVDHADRIALVERLAALHDATDRVRTIAPRRDAAPILRAIEAIEGALAQTGRPWTGGPFSEPARHWLREEKGAVGQLLADATQLLEQTARPDASLVVTHGEPHPGNVIDTDRGLVLIDWETVGLAPPERDLWMFADDERLLAHYTQTTTRSLDPRAIQLYDFAWTLGDLSVMLDDLRSAHVADEDSTQTWRLLERMEIRRP